MHWNNETVKLKFANEVITIRIEDISRRSRNLSTHHECAKWARISRNVAHLAQWGAFGAEWRISDTRDKLLETIQDSRRMNNFSD